MFCFKKYVTFETSFCMLKAGSRNKKFRETRSIFCEIRNWFRMKFSRILYERNSSVNPTRNTGSENKEAASGASFFPRIFGSSQPDFFTPHMTCFYYTNCKEILINLSVIMFLSLLVIFI